MSDWLDIDSLLEWVKGLFLYDSLLYLSLLTLIYFWLRLSCLFLTLSNIGDESEH